MVQVVSTAAATSMSPPPAKGANGMLPWRVDITIIGWIQEAIVGMTVVPMIDSCVHCICHRTIYGRAASKNVVLIMPSGWTASSSVGVRGSHRCKASGRTGWSASTAAEAAVQVEHRLNLVRSRETDRENGYENQSPVFSYARSPRNYVLFLHFSLLLPSTSTVWEGHGGMVLRDKMCSGVSTRYSGPGQISWRFMGATD